MCTLHYVCVCVYYITMYIMPYLTILHYDCILYSGEDDLGCEYTYQGASGVISVTANVAPKKMHE